MAAVCILGALCQGASWRELLEEEKVKENATHELIVRDSDLTNSTAQFTQTVAIASVTMDAVMLASVKLTRPFKDTNNLSGNTSLWLRVGDGTGPGFYLDTTSVSLSNNPVYLSVNRTSNKVYTAADTLDATFVPGTNFALDALDDGEVRILFRSVHYP